MSRPHNQLTTHNDTPTSVHNKSISEIANAIIYFNIFGKKLNIYNYINKISLEELFNFQIQCRDDD